MRTESSVRRVLLVLLSGLLSAACSGPSATAPAAPTATPPTTTPSTPAVSKVWLCCGSNQVRANIERQIEARATYSDGSIRDVTTAVTSWRSSNPKIATISSTGVVRGVVAGDFEISATYEGMEATWGLYVLADVLGPVGPDEVVGYVQELTVNGLVPIHRAEVEIVGGPSDGRKVLTLYGSGFFRLVGLQSAGFELIVREAGYSTKRFRVSQLGVDVSSATVMTTAPTMVSDVLEGAVCWPTRTISAMFTPTAAGFLRITSARYNSTSRAVYGDGILVKSPVSDNVDVSMRAGVNYELRVTGSCDYNPGQTVRLTFLRPR